MVLVANCLLCFLYLLLSSASHACASRFVTNEKESAKKPELDLSISSIDGQLYWMAFLVPACTVSIVLKKMDLKWMVEI